ncbi:MAG: P-II family nitrogen regulator [Bacteroidales bacterium]
MKAVFVVFNQANIERVEYALDILEIKGWTLWQDVQGKGTHTGEPHRGTHTWPEMNSSIIAMVDEDKVAPLLDKIKKIDEVNESVGIRAFVWDILQTV